MNHAERTMELHPLHSAEWLNEIVVSTGCYPDIARRTGRTTSIAMRTIANAIGNPGQRVQFRDHHGTANADRYLGRLIADIIWNQGLKHMHVDLDECTLTFENRDGKAPMNSEYARCSRM